MKIRFLLAGLASLFCCLSVQAAVVASVAQSRVQTSWTLDGGSMTTTRAKLLDSSNFGGGGTVGEAITIDDITALDGGALNGADVFFMGYKDESVNPFSGAELDALESWINGGGVAILTCDSSGYDELCDHFGQPTVAGATNPWVVTPDFDNSPLFDGPFGQISGALMWGDYSSYAGGDGWATLAVDSSGSDRPFIIGQQYGNGAIIMVGDVDTLSNNTLSGGTGISNDNDVWMGNLFAAAINGVSGLEPPVEVPVPTMGPAGLVTLLALMLLVGGVAVRRFA